MQAPLLITGNTRAPILDGNGKPLVNGTLLVTANSDSESSPLSIFREPSESSPPVKNPIRLNSAGAMPYAIYTDAAKAWCHAYDERGEYVLSYPLNGNLPAESGESNGESLSVSEMVVERLSVLKQAIIKGDLKAENISLSALNFWDKFNLQAVEILVRSPSVDGLIYMGKNEDKLVLLAPSAEIENQILAKEIEAKNMLKAKNIQLKEMDPTDGEKRTLSMVNIERAAPEIANNTAAVNFLDAYYPVGSYLTVESNGNDMYKINQILYGRGANDHGSIDIYTNSSNFVEGNGIFKVCGFTGTGNSRNYFLVRRIK